jgi:ComF family protein
VLQNALRTVRDGLLGLAYPQECRVCGGAVQSWDDGIACAVCWNDPNVTKLIEGSVCVKCGVPVSQSVVGARSSLPGRPGGNPRLCGLCSGHPFAAARACGIYSGALEASILFLKVNPHICSRLRSLIARTFSEHSEVLASELTVPVPLHRLREKQRGFNQAAIVARIISKNFHFPLDDHSLLRTKPTERHRAGLDATDRARSVEQAFAVSRPALISGASVLLVDDVFTTGSTICAAARCLLEAGARQVSVLTIARVG